MSEDPSEEFVTVSAAAAMLGVSDRTARRMAGQLADDDRTAVSGQGRRVRLSAMRFLREKGGQPADSMAGQNPAMTARTKSADRGRPVNVADPVTGELAEALQRAAVAEAVNQRLSGEVAFLRESLQREQAIAMTATSDASELRRKLEALTDGLIEASSAGNPMHGAEAGKSHAVGNPMPSSGARESHTDPIDEGNSMDAPGGGKFYGDPASGSRKTTETAGFWGRVRMIFTGSTGE